MTINFYTTILFGYGLYQPNKHKLENLRLRFNVVWNEKRLQSNVPYEEIFNTYRIFKTENRIKTDENLKGRNGATGVWSNKNDTLKIVIFDAINTVESPPTLLIYRGVEGEFYKTLVKMCVDLGCEIGRLEEDENGMREVFKRKLKLEDVERLRSFNGSKEVMEKLFDIRIDELQKFGYLFSSSFIELWKKCIDDYGYYSNEKLGNELQIKNENNYNNT